MAFAIVYAIAAIDWTKFAAAAKRASNAQEFINQLETSFPTVYTAIVISIVAVSISILMATVLYPVFQAIVLRWWISGLRFETLTIRSRLRTGQIYGAYLRFLWYGVLFSLAVGIAGGVLYSSVNGMLTAVKIKTVADVVKALTGLAIYVATMLGFSAIYQGTVKLAFWRYSVETAKLTGAEVLDEVKAEGVPSSAVGEGLADALNVGSF
jgi:hypothetical protein